MPKRRKGLKVVPKKVVNAPQSLLTKTEKLLKKFAQKVGV
jgi:hypothetical protein